MGKKQETTAEKAVRIKRMRSALAQDMREFGCIPDLDDDEIAELQWLSDKEEAQEAYELERYEEKQHGL